MIGLKSKPREIEDFFFVAYYSIPVGCNTIPVARDAIHITHNTIPIAPNSGNLQRGQGAPHDTYSKWACL